MAKLIDEFCDFINSIIRAIVIILMGAMTLIVLLQVVTRLCPGIYAPNWTEELSRYIMIYIAFIGAGNGIREWSNVGVDFVFDSLPKVPKYILDIIIRVAVMVFWIVVAYWGYKYFPKVGGKQLSATMRFPMLYAQASLIIGGILCVLQSVGGILNKLVGGPDNG